MGPEIVGDKGKSRTPFRGFYALKLVPKVVSCLQTVGNTISSTSVSRGVFYGPGH
eukprot:COSAG03_NODE_10583_length_641_cov_5.158672_1_plen_54_part_10